MDYTTACLLMGAGVATDVVLMVIAQFRFVRADGRWLIWILFVSATHILFPMAGYYSTLSLYDLGGALRVGVGVGAAGLLIWHVWGILREMLGAPQSSQADDRSDLPGSLGSGLAVSWDALLSGPAKAAQAVSWTDSQILWSFLIVGVVVAVAGFGGVSLAIAFRRWSERQSSRSLSTAIAISVNGVILEVGIFLYFAALSVTVIVFELKDGEVIALLVSAGFVFALCLGGGRRLRQQAREKLVSQYHAD